MTFTAKLAKAFLPVAFAASTTGCVGGFGYGTTTAVSSKTCRIEGNTEVCTQTVVVQEPPVVIMAPPVYPARAYSVYPGGMYPPSYYTRPSYYGAPRYYQGPRVYPAPPPRQQPPRMPRHRR